MAIKTEVKKTKSSDLQYLSKKGPRTKTKPKTAVDPKVRVNRAGINKVTYLDISTQVVAEIVKRAVKNKAPKDAEVVRLSYDTNRNSWRVFIRSDEFAPVPEGAPAPEMAPPVIGNDILK